MKDDEKREAKRSGIEQTAGAKDKSCPRTPRRTSTGSWTRASRRAAGQRPCLVKITK